MCKFICHDCGLETEIDSLKDITTSSGCCPLCGSDDWKICIIREDGSEEYV